MTAKSNEKTDALEKEGVLHTLASQDPEKRVRFFCGGVSGVLCACLFNPWDRALYLSVKNNVPFLCIDNWRHPFQGCMQSFAHRVLSNGLYFPIESVCNEFVAHFYSSVDPLKYLYVGILAGLCSAAAFHPVAVSKYRQWGSDGDRLLYVVKELWRGGAASMYRAVTATLCRDITFAGIFCFLRHYFSSKVKARFDSQTARATHPLPLPAPSNAPSHSSSAHLKFYFWWPSSYSLLLRLSPFSFYLKSVPHSKLPLPNDMFSITPPPPYRHLIPLTNWYLKPYCIQKSVQVLYPANNRASMEPLLPTKRCMHASTASRFTTALANDIPPTLKGIEQIQWPQPTHGYDRPMYRRFRHHLLPENSNDRLLCAFTVDPFISSYTGFSTFQSSPIQTPVLCLDHPKDSNLPPTPLDKLSGCKKAQSAITPSTAHSHVRTNECSYQTNQFTTVSSVSTALRPTFPHSWLPICLFLCNSTAASVAVILASPFNYVRNVKFSHPNTFVPHSITILKELKRECCKEPTNFRALSHLQRRLCIGWGSARVAVGMGLAAYLYEWCTHY